MNDEAYTPTYPHKDATTPTHNFTSPPLPVRPRSDNYMADVKTSCKSYVSTLMSFNSWHTGMLPGHTGMLHRSLQVNKVVLCDIPYRGKPLLTWGPDSCFPVVSHSGRCWIYVVFVCAHKVVLCDIIYRGNPY